MSSTLKRQLPLANLRQILAIKFIRVTHQIHAVIYIFGDGIH